MAAPRTLLTVVLAALLLLPGSAEAAGRGKQSPTATAPGAPDPVAVAVAVARRYWGAAPCGGRFDVRARRSLARGADPAVNAWVTFGSARGPNDLSAAPSTYADCVINLARWRWPTTASMREDWDLLCTTVVHELGHLLGRDHDTALGSLMAPVFTSGASTPPACRATRPNGAPRAAESRRQL